MMSGVSVETLYKCFDTISSESSSDAEKLKSFNSILLGIKGGPNEKKLASQFISRFFNKFKSSQGEAFDCMLDLCDDDDPQLRMQVVRDLQHVCKLEPSYTARVADVLCQMLLTENIMELHAVNQTLLNLLVNDPGTVLTGVFNQILSTDSDLQRTHSLKFLSEKLKEIPKDKLTQEVESFIIEQSSKLLEAVSDSAFVQTVALLSSLPSMTSLLGRQKLIIAITNHVIHSVPHFQPRNESSLILIQNCGKLLTKLFSKNVSAGELLKYLLLRVVPVLTAVPSSSKQLSLLQLLIEVSSHPGDLFKSTSLPDQFKLLEPLYSLLLSLFPQVTDLSFSSEVDLPDIQAFSLECALFAFLNLLKLCPQFLDMTGAGGGGDVGGGEASGRLQVLRKQAQYTARLLQSYKAAILAAFLAQLKAEGLTSIETAEQARRAFSNLERMLRVLFRNRIEADCLNDLVLSWMPQTQQKPSLVALPPPTTTGGKRPPDSVDFRSAPAVKMRSPLQRSFNRRGGGLVGRGRSRGRRF